MAEIYTSESSEEEKKVGLFSSYIRKPTTVRFETQEKKEEIVLILRRHLITNLPWVLILILMIFIPLIVPKLVSLDFAPDNYRLIATICWYLITFAFAFEKFLCWLFNVNIITDRRVIDIDFPTILYRDISEAKLDKIQDVSIKTGGFVRSLFNYGDVLIQTAGSIPEICFEAVPNPSRINKVLNKIIKEDKDEGAKS